MRPTLALALAPALTLAPLGPQWLYLHTPPHPFLHIPTQPYTSTHTNQNHPNTIQVRPTIIEGQGHQMGDEGWEQSVMGPLRTFLDGLT